MSSDMPDLSELMTAAQNGDQKAYRQLLEAITPRLKSFLYRRFFNSDAVEDILQDVLIALHRARHTYRPDQPFENWMYGIARHKLVDAIRKQTRIGNYEAGAENISDLPVTKTEDGTKSSIRQIDNDIRLALDILPKKQRQLVEYTKIQGHSVEETAQKFSMSESAVKTSTHRSLKKMQKWLIRNGYA